MAGSRKQSILWSRFPSCSFLYNPIPDQINIRNRDIQRALAYRRSEQPTKMSQRNDQARSWPWTTKPTDKYSVSPDLVTINAAFERISFLHSCGSIWSDKGQQLPPGAIRKAAGYRLVTVGSQLRKMLRESTSPYQRVMNALHRDVSWEVLGRPLTLLLASVECYLNGATAACLLHSHSS